MLARINLVPRRTLAQQIRRAVPVLVGGGLLMVAGIVVGRMQYLDWQIRTVGKDVERLQVRENTVKEQQERMKQLGADLKRLEEEQKVLQVEVDNLAKIPEQKQCFSVLLDLISGNLPVTVRCEKVALGATSGQIAGQATVYRELPDFVQRLGDVPGVRNVSMTVLNQGTEQETGLLSFKIVFELQANQPAACNK